MKLWDKGYSTAQAVETFTVGKDRELDMHLAPWDVLGTMAHIEMLEAIDLLEAKELGVLQAELKNIYAQIEAGDFEIEDGIEDVHSQVELMLTRNLGEVGKKVHSGRSRNDQVLVDLKLYFRQEVTELLALIQTLFSTLQKLSEKHKDILIPGYTHFQVAMPSSFGLWFGAYAEALVDDVQMLAAAYKVSDQNPLGSAAGYGSSFPLKRQLTTDLLGFQSLSYNVVYAQMGRGKTEQLLGYALASIGATLNKLAADVCLYMSQNFAFLTFPDNLTTGSSIMPHKKNPDVFELVRARTNLLMSLPASISHLTSNLPSGYHRDLQLTKEVLLPGIEETKACLHISNFMLEQVQVKDNVLESPIYDYLFSVEVVNREVLNGLAFREAYKKIGQQIQEGNFKPDREVSHTHEGSIGNLCTEEIATKMEMAASEIDSDKWRMAIRNLLQR
ncbi:MAG: argininosuccinate lyase [Bacteroidia bacterium]